MEIKLGKRVKYAGDVHTELMNAGFTPKEAAELLGRVPDADVAPVVHGQWIKTMPILGAGDAETRCSVCGRICYEENAPYCYCGAKMEG